MTPIEQNSDKRQATNDKMTMAMTMTKGVKEVRS